MSSVINIDNLGGDLIDGGDGNPTRSLNGDGVWPDDFRNISSGQPETITPRTYINMISSNSHPYTFEGNNHTITISSSNTDYFGLFCQQPFTDSPSGSIIIQNLTIVCNTSIINLFPTTTFPAYFGGGGLYIGNWNSTTDKKYNNVIINNCHVIMGDSTFFLNAYCGGIVGSGFSGSINNCSFISAATQTSINYGCIAGSLSGTAYMGQVEYDNINNYYNYYNSSGTCTISNCYSNCIISNNSGGIVGSAAADQSGICTIYDCYSTGNISNGSGGIVGANAASGSGLCTIYNCYSKGNITGGEFGGSGGITGINAGGSVSLNSTGNCNIYNCYSIGSIDTSCGGIFGQNAGSAIGCYARVYSSYVSGTLTPSALATPKVTGIIGTGIGGNCGADNFFYVGANNNNTQVYLVDVNATNADGAYFNNCYGLNCSGKFGITSITCTNETSLSSSWFNGTTNISLNMPIANNLYTNAWINSTNQLTYTISGQQYSSYPLLNDFTLQRTSQFYRYYKFDDAPTFSIPYIDKLQYVGNPAPTIDTNTHKYTLNSNANWPSDFKVNGYTPSVSDIIYLKDSTGNVWTFDGNNKTITIEQTDYSTPSYLGLFTGDINNWGAGNDTVTIQNLTISCFSVDYETYTNNLYGGGGIFSYISSSDYKNNNLIDNCHTIGIPNKPLYLAYRSGGIVGNNAGLNGTCTITDCSSIYTIDPDVYTPRPTLYGECGGIAGNSAGSYNDFSNSVCIINNCNSTCVITDDISIITNNISMNFGGIVGSNSALKKNVPDTSAILQISNCNYSGIVPSSCGGIVGSGSITNGGQCNISDCNVNSIFIDNYSGGIVGSGSITNGGQCNISDCTITCDYLSTFAGGIVGSNSITNSISCFISDCNVTCSYIGSECGGLIGNNSILNGAVCTIEDCIADVGAISNAAGGLIGNNSIINNSNCNIFRCTTNATELYQSSGGMIGNGSIINSGNCSIIGCTINGNIITGNQSGGVIGGANSISNGVLSISDCNSIFTTISGTQSGGLIGGGNITNGGTCSIDTCVFTGTISGTESGGLIGGGSITNGGSCGISDCNTLGNIYSTCGGIIGSGSIINNGTCTITNCSATGTTMISNTDTDGCGGIIGNNSIDNSSCYINNSFFNGDIGQIDTQDDSLAAGGILGNNCGYNSICNINNCYSTGNNIGYHSGGIVGANIGTCNINNCYSSQIINSYGGGITGAFAGNNSGLVNITNCYSNGNIYDAAGGICGYYTAPNPSSICNITNCYSTGDISFGAGGITGQGDGSGTINISNCYSAGQISKSTDGILIQFGGAIVGQGTENCFISNCYYAGQTDASSGYFIGSVYDTRTIQNRTNASTVTISSNCYGTCLLGDPNSTTIYTTTTSNYITEQNIPTSSTSLPVTIPSWFLPSTLNTNGNYNWSRSQNTTSATILYPMLTAFNVEPWYGYNTYTSTPKLS